MTSEVSKAAKHGCNSSLQCTVHRNGYLIRMMLVVLNTVYLQCIQCTCSTAILIGTAY